MGIDIWRYFNVNLLMFVCYFLGGKSNSSGGNHCRTNIITVGYGTMDNEGTHEGRLVIY